MKKSRRLALLACASFAGLVAAPAVYAETAGDMSGTGGTAAPAGNAPATQQASTGSTGLEVIVVTARRKQESLQKTPVAVTALTGQNLADHGISQLVDLTAHVPALRIEGYNSPDVMIPGIRGQRNTEVVPGYDQSVGFDVDGVAYGYPVGTTQTFFDLQSVQVLKGPQGTLFGQNTTGGAILLTTNKPTDRFEGLAKLGTTVFDGGAGVYTTDVINAPISDVVAIRAAVNVVSRDGYVANDAPRTTLPTVPAGLPQDTNTRLNDDHRVEWRISLSYDPNEDFENLLVYAGSTLNDHGTGYHITSLSPPVLIASPPYLVGGFLSAYYPYVAPAATQALYASAQAMFDAQQAQYARNFWSTQSNLGRYNKDFNQSAADTATWKLSDALTVKNIFGWHYFRNDALYDLSGVPMEVIYAAQPEHGNEFSDELQVRGKLGSGIGDYVAGLYYSNQDVKHGFGSAILGGPMTVEPTHSLVVSYAAYAQADWFLGFIDPRLSLTTGVRYTHDQRTMDINGNDPNGYGCLLTDAGGNPIASGPACSFHDQKEFDAWTYTLGLNFQAGPHTLIYLASRRGFRAGGFAPDVTAAATNLPFASEFVTDYEAGLKRDWHFGDMALRTNLAAYYQRYTNVQEFVAAQGSNPADVGIINAAGAHIPGGELEVTFLPTENLEIDGSLAVVFPKFTDFPTALGNLKANAFGQIPMHQYTVGMRYTLPFVDSIGRITAGADYYYQTHIYFTTTAEGPGYGPYASQGQSGYGLTNFRLDWTAIMQSQFDASFYVNNAFATKYLNFGIQLYNSLGSNIATIGDPRVFGFELRYHFD